jgi:uncharacterized Fe-S cluster protein YjdI
VPLDTTGAVLTGISCPTTTFCVAVDSAGNAAIDTSGTWSLFTPVAGAGNEFLSVSCGSTTFCVAVGATPDNPDFETDLAVIYSNGVWSSNTSKSVAPEEMLESVSCAPGTEFCVAVGWAESSPGNTEVSQTYNGQTWTVSSGMGYGGEGDQLLTASCASTTFCVTGGIDQDRANVGDQLDISYHGKEGGGQITNDQATGLSGALYASACAGDSCLVAGNTNLVFTVKRQKWAGPTDPDGSRSIEALSCPSGSTCVAVDNVGDVLTDKSGVWSAPVMIDESGDLTALSCPTTSFCMATDSDGNIVVGS